MVIKTAVYEGPIDKSETDNCHYRYITLSNGLKALIVHEPNCQKASAALDVHIGSFHDPENIPGLAHFLEHLLFMGTEKYPSENDYGKFLNEHGGSSNAFTASEHTNYFCDVNCGHLEGALDRFAQFFVAPLFLESSTEREMQAVDSEHSKNILQDNWRLSQLEKTLANPEHPYHKFGTGDLKTLGEIPRSEGIDIRSTLLAFHKRWYSANIMSLVVLGKETLDELQAMVEKKFSAVPNIDASLPSWNGLPWTDEQRSTFIRVKSIKDSKNLYMTWLCPDTKSEFLIKQQKLFSHLIGHEGHGSILQALKKRGWATALSAGCDDDSTGYSFFEVSVELSTEGLENYRQVIDLVFQYVEKILENPESDQTFLDSVNECMQLSNMNFRFREREDPSHFAYRVARNMHRYPAKYVLSGPHIQEDGNVQKIAEYGRFLNRQNCRVILATKDDPDYEGTWIKERWYGTEHYVDQLQNHVGKVEASDLHLPSKNEFVPETFNVIIKPAKTEPVKQPSLVHENDCIKVWHKTDDTFETPKAHVRVLLRTPIPTSSVEDSVALQLYIEVLKDKLTPTLYPAELAGLSYDFSVVNEGVEIKLSGFAEKLPLLLKSILESASIEECLNYGIIREQYEKRLLNLEHEQPYWHCSYIANGILQQKTWWYWQRIPVAGKMSLGQVLETGKKLFSACVAEVLVHGSVLEPTEYIQILESYVKKPNIKKVETFDALNLSGRTAHRLPKNLSDPNSAIEMVYQTALTTDISSRSLTSLVVQAFSEPFFDQLRTKVQLGYIVFCGKREKYDRLGVRFVIQSTKGDPIFLENHISSFIQALPQMIQEMTEESFQDICTALVTKLRQRKVRISQETGSYWDQIVPSTYDWTRNEDDAKYLESSVTKTDLLSFVKKHLLESPNYLVVQAWPSNGTTSESVYSTSGGPPLA